MDYGLNGSSYASEIANEKRQRARYFFGILIIHTVILCIYILYKYGNDVQYVKESV